MPRRVVWAIAAAVGLWLSWVFQPLIFKLYGAKWDPVTLGQWGDSFGVLNALFATLGFAAALYTLRVQQQQISRDRFDTYFFELLKLFIEAREKVSFRHSASYINSKILKGKNQGLIGRLQGTSSYSGLNAFQEAWLEVRYWAPSMSASSAELVNAYDTKIHARSEITLGPYFRLLYTILKRIDRDKYLSDSDKNLYGNLIRSQLSQYEIAIAGLNGMSAVSKDFDEFIKTFRILKYSTGTRRTLLSHHYPAYAFQGRDDVI